MMIDDDEPARTAEKLQEAEAKGEERERRAPSSSGQVVQKLPVSSHSNVGSHSGVSADRRGGLSDKEQNYSPPQAKGKTGHFRPLCSVGWCTNFAKDGGVCIRHGATPSSKSQSKVRKKCAMEGCDAFARRGGVCIRHGATESRKTCSREGCINQAQRGGVCTRHGSRRPLCSREGCTKYAQKGGVCARHGASVSRKMCSIEGCTNQAQKGGVCAKHRAKKTETCTRQGCTDVAENGGVCVRHGAGQNYKNGATFSVRPPPVKHAGEKESFKEKAKGSARPPIKSVRKESTILPGHTPKKGGRTIESGISQPQSSKSELLGAASSCPDETPPGGGAPSTLPPRETMTDGAEVESSSPASGVTSKPAAPASVAENITGSHPFARAPSRRTVLYVHDAGDHFTFDANDQLREESLQRCHFGAAEKVRELCDPPRSGACAGRRPVEGSTTGWHEGDKEGGLELLCSALQLDEGDGVNGNAREDFVDPVWGVWEKSKKIPGQNDAGDSDDEDEMATLIYDSSHFAEAWADEIELSSPVFRDPLVSSALKRPPNSDLLCGDASQLVGGDGFSPQNFGDSEDYAQAKNAVKRKASASLQAVTESKRAKLLPMPKKLAKNAVASSAAPEANKAKPPLARKKKPTAKEKENKYSMRTYNRYNIFFIFEREKLLQSKGGGGSSSVGHHTSSPRDAEEESRLVRENYGDLRLPPLPPRFAGLAIPDGWFIPRNQRGKRRPHRKTRDGAGTFLWLVKSIAKAWKEVDRETLEWTMEVEKALRQNQMRQLLHERENNSGEKVECNDNAEIEEGIWSESPDVRPVKPAAETQVQSKLTVGTGVVHNKKMTHDKRAPPSPVTSKYEPPSSATSKHAGHFEGGPAGHGKSGVEHFAPNALDAVWPAADDVPRSKEEELRTWMVDYFKNSAATFNDATDPVNAEAASHDDAFEELRKYLSVMKCAEIMREKAVGEIRQRILPRLLLPSDSAGGTEWWQQLSQQSCSYTDLPAPSTTGNGVSNRWYHDLLSPAQRMLDPEHVGPILETKQEPRILEETRGGNSGDGPLAVADREEGRRLYSTDASGLWGNKGDSSKKTGYNEEG